MFDKGSTLCVVANALPLLAWNGRPPLTEDRSSIAAAVSGACSTSRSAKNAMLKTCPDIGLGDTRTTPNSASSAETWSENGAMVSC
jgi:hypothetical protein